MIWTCLLCWKKWLSFISACDHFQLYHPCWSRLAKVSGRRIEWVSEYVKTVWVKRCKLTLQHITHILFYDAISFWCQKHGEPRILCPYHADLEMQFLLIYCSCSSSVWKYKQTTGYYWKLLVQSHLSSEKSRNKIKPTKVCYMNQKTPIWSENITKSRLLLYI